MQANEPTDSTYYTAAYSQLLLLSLFETLKEQGVLSAEQAQATFARAAKMAKAMADQEEVPAIQRATMREVHELLLEGAGQGKNS